jgi:hypothetical protein
MRDLDGIDGSPDSTVPKSTGLSGASSISMSYQTACALTKDTRVFCWGVPYTTAAGPADPVVPVGAGSPTEVPSLAGATALNAAPTQACALREGKVSCFEFRGYDRPSEPVPANPTPFAADPQWLFSRIYDIQLPFAASTFDAGVGGGCATSTSGQVACWGAYGACRRSAGKVRCNPAGAGPYLIQARSIAAQAAPSS